MAPSSRLILTRHAQAEHNVTWDWSIPDAPLTALGKKQAASLAPKIQTLQDEVDLIVTSPLQRTLQTTRLAWGPAMRRLGIENVICLPEAQECSDNPCDTGSSKATLEGLQEFAGFDLFRLTPDWTSKKSFWAPDPASIANRARSVRHFLRDRPEKNIVLVAHGDVLRAITGDSQGFSDYLWKNAEARIYEFDQQTVASDDCFLRLAETIAAAGGYGPTSNQADLGDDLEDNR